MAAHEAWLFGAFGAEPATQIPETHFAHLGAPVARVWTSTSDISFSPPLERVVAPEAEEVARTVRTTIGHRGRTTSAPGIHRGT